jgi:hypothetical protein
MNRYAGDAALEVQADIHDGELSVNVRARVDESGRQVSVGGLGSTAADAAQQCLELRRNLQALGRSTDAEELHNEIAMLRRREARRAGRPPRSQEEVEATARLARLERIERSLREVTEQVCRLEDEVLLHLYAQAPLDLARFSGEVRSAGERAFEALLALYFLRFPQPDSVTLAVYGEEPQRLFELAGAYYQWAVDRGGRVEVWQFLSPRAGREKEAVPERRLVLDSRELFAGAAVVNVRDWDRQAKGLTAAHAADARAGVIGIALFVRAPGAFVRLAPETGLHVFTAPNRTDRCLVDTSPDAPSAYKPPEGIERRGSIGSQPKRRSYSETQRLAEDPVLGRKLPWPRDALAELLAEALELRLCRDACSLWSLENA